ncbi:MAG: energy-coupled thiamine transporter ThiT [Clostridia bacterium]|nr:energy-coupled thiamine transporter ThiT [Clostridia bacterium]
MKRHERTRILVECALMVALGTVLSIFPLVEMPYGGSVTLASMLPCLLIAYRHGTAWGLGTAFVHAVVQQLLGLKNLSYFTTWQSVVAVIVLDYLLAFVVIGLGGMFRKRIAQQNLALASGAVVVCVLRYICHVIAGATVWAGLSIPTQAALAYSFSYNATYMIPEAIVLAVTAYYLGSVLDFGRELPTRMPSKQGQGLPDLLFALALLSAAVGVIVDIVLIGFHLQNPESGVLDFSLLAVPFVGSFWLAVVIVTNVCLLVCVGLLIARKIILARSKQ